jgi:hypothetical protein
MRLKTKCFIQAMSCRQIERLAEAWDWRVTGRRTNAAVRWQVLKHAPAAGEVS